MNWRRLHPSDIPRGQWLTRLDTIPNASPYLLPEWSLFWQNVWPNSRAEVYDNGTVLIPTVSRHRYGLTWRFAQPYGTDCIIGKADGIDWAFLAAEMSQMRAVEISIGADVPISILGWNRALLAQNRWIINTAGRTFTELSHDFSGSHRRNIAKGEELQLRIDDACDPERLRRLWKDTHRAPRFMLNPPHAQALIRRFEPVGALHWRTAWAGERPVAGIVFLVHKHVAVYLDPIVDLDPQFRGAGHFLLADSLKLLIDSGVSRFDLGGAPGNDDTTGLSTYKSGWAATHESIHTTLYRRNWYSTLRRFR